MRKTLLAAIAATTLLSIPQAPAQARGGNAVLGFGLGLLGGAAIGGALAGPQSYYGNRGYYAEPGYYAPPPPTFYAPPPVVYAPPPAYFPPPRPLFMPPPPPPPPCAYSGYGCY